MRKFLLAIWLLIICVGNCFSQNAARADALFIEGKYPEAEMIYLALHKREPSHPLYTYRLARCKQELGQIDQAILLFREAGTKYNLRNFFLAELCYQTYRFEEAKEMYTAYLDNIDSEEERYQYTIDQIARTDRMIRYFRKMEDVAIYDSLSIRQDSLYTYISATHPEIGTFACNDGLFSYTNQRGDRRYITVRDSDGRTLLCKQEKLLNEWSEPDTLPAGINQNKLQNYPFLMPDGMTLYYAASSDNGLGSWDIYVTRFNPSSNSYIKPELLNMPYNSISNDMLLWVNENTGKGFFFSDRTGTMKLYTFLPSDKKTFLEETDDYKREYARLLTLRQPNADVDELQQHNVVTQKEGAYDFTIVINDSTIYHYLQDFRSDETRQIAKNYLDELAQINEGSEQLSAYRAAYKNAESAEEKRSLTPLILSLEKDIIRLKKETNHLLLEIRQKEK